MDILGKIAIVTGSGHGIGRQIALDLAVRGVNLILCSRNYRELAEVSEEAKKSGIRCIPVEADLSTGVGIQKVIDAAVNQFGTIDILVNNAGVMFHDGIEGVTEKGWDLTFAVNAKATMFLSQKAMPYMQHSGGGYIVNICSTVALGAKPEVTSYSASKYAVMGISEALYKAGKRFGIRVSSIYPGVTDTPLLRRAEDRPCPPEKWLQPEDISRCVLFLLTSPERMVIKDIVPWSTGFDQI